MYGSASSIIIQCLVNFRFIKIACYFVNETVCEIKFNNLTQNSTIIIIHNVNKTASLAT